MGVLTVVFVIDAAGRETTKIPSSQSYVDYRVRVVSWQLFQGILTRKIGEGGMNSLSQGQAILWSSSYEDTI